MLEKQYRLKKNKEFNYIYKKGKTVSNKVLSVVYVKTKLDNIKVGFSISNKVGNSVVRHKIKRQLTHLFKEFINQVNKNYNYIFVARQGIELIEYNDMRIQMQRVLQKAELLN